MKEGWEIKMLGEVTTFRRGLTYSKADEVAFSKNVVLRSNNVDLSTNTLNLDEVKYISEIIDIPEEKKVQKGSILICTANGSKSHLGKVAVIDEDYGYAFGGFMGLLIPNDEVDVNYLHLLMSSDIYKSFINSLSDGANINNLKYKDLARFTFPIPPLPEQQRIVEVLDREFERIGTIRRNAEAGLKYAKDLMQAKLKEELQQKEGWERKKVKELGKVQTGSTPSTSDKANYGDYLPFIKPADVNYDGLGGLNYDGQRLSLKGAELSRIMDAHSILMVCIGATIGKVGFATRTVTSNQQINALTPNSDFDYRFIFYYMKSENFQKEVLKAGESSKATLPIINKTKWENLLIYLPSLLEQQQIVARLDRCSETCKKIEENSKEIIAHCDALKQALLRKAFCGEL